MQPSASSPAEMPGRGAAPFAWVAEPPGVHVSLMVTRRCNMQCGHCSVESGPGIKAEPGEAELLRYVREAAAAGVRSVRLTGGEPMLKAALVRRLITEC